MKNKKVVNIMKYYSERVHLSRFKLEYFELLYFELKAKVFLASKLCLCSIICKSCSSLILFALLMRSIYCILSIILKVEFLLFRPIRVLIDGKTVVLDSLLLDLDPSSLFVQLLLNLCAPFDERNSLELFFAAMLGSFEDLTLSSPGSMVL